MPSRSADEGIDLSKSIEELEESYWGEPEFASTFNIKSYAARRKPLRDLSPNDLRLSLIKQSGVRYVVQLAIDLLRDDPMAEGLAFEGDVLAVLLQIPRPFWLEHPDWAEDVERIYARFLVLAVFMRESWRECCLPSVIESLDSFVGKSPSAQWHCPDGGPY